jgi:hypothetical protein
MREGWSRSRLAWLSAALRLYVGVLDHPDAVVVVHLHSPDPGAVISV